MAATAVCILGGCIENDIPYPRIQPNITEFEVRGQLRAAAIDSASRTVTVVLNDSVDIYNLELLRWGITDGARVVSPDIQTTLNLAEPLEVTLGLYQDYVWTISATQTINRNFTVASQIGAAEIDVQAHTVRVMIPTSVSLQSVRVLTAVLGQPGSVITPALEGKTVDFSQPVTVTVSQFGRQEQWTITVEQTELSAEITSVDAWTNVAWVYASVQEGKDVELQYRPAAGGEWSVVPEQWIERNGGDVAARLVHLTAETRYEVRALSDGQTTPETEFVTGSVAQPHNAMLTNWNLDGKIWCPWALDADPYWGTGNKGATTLGDSNTTPIIDSQSPTGYAGASLETRFVGIGMLGKLAAGNLFAGSYVRTEGTNGVLSFGRPFVERPTALRARIRYTTADISHSSTEYAYLKGRPDTCSVWCALIDSEEPFEIRTKPTDRHLFDPEGSYVVAYGNYLSGSSHADYVDVEIPLRYTATNRVPRWIILVASASKYGDFFTGGAGAVLMVKEFELLYDYND